MTVYYYTSPSGDNPIIKFIDSLENRQQVKILRIFQYLERYGVLTILPHVKKLTGTPFWEIRILGRDNIRIFYITLTKTSLLILHGFIKKTDKTPKKEIAMAYKRYNDWQKR